MTENKVKKNKEKARKPFYKRLLPMALVLVIIGGVIFGVREWVYYNHYESTDDAQIDGDISPVIARVGGYVQVINFEDNQLVQKGDTLVILDARDYKIQLEKAKAALEAAKSGVDVSSSHVNLVRANVPPAKANVQVAEAKLWKITQAYNRYKNLLKSHSITQAKFDAIKAKKKVAEAKVTAIKKQISAIHQNVASSEKQVKATQSKIDVRQATVDFAKLQLSYTVITAPVSGIVSKRNIDIGQLVRPGQKMFAIVNAGSVYVTANFKETQIGEMKVGQPVKIHVNTYSDHLFHGHVASFSGATGAKFSLLPPNNATGNYVKVVQRVPVRIHLDSLSEKWESRLILGMSVKAEVRINKK